MANDPTPPQAPARERLEQRVGMLDLVMLGAGTAMGASVFAVLGPAARVSGSGMLIAIVLAAIPMTLFGGIYAFLASALPRSGASYEWQRAFVHPQLAFAIGWLRIMGSALLMVTMGHVLVGYVGMVVAIQERPVIGALFIGIFALNYLGIGVAARAQTLLMLGLLSVFALFVVAGARHVALTRIGDPLAVGWGAILAGVPLLIQLFLGIETTTEVSGEVRDAQTTVPRALAMALMLGCGVYLVVAFTALGIIGPAALGASKAPLLSAAIPGLGQRATPIIVIAAALALIKSMNAIFMVNARFLFAMGRAGSLPRLMGAIDARGRPRNAVIAAFLGACMALAVPGDLVFLFLAVNIPVMMKYFGTSLAAFNVAVRRADVFDAARLPFSRRQIKAMAGAAMMLALVIAGLGLQTDWRPYAVLGGGGAGRCGARHRAVLARLAAE